MADEAREEGYVISGCRACRAYLKELGETVEYYPTGTGATMKELGEGSRDMIASTTGWDINPRVLGTVPKEARVVALKGFHWVSDAHYMAVPKGVPDDLATRVAVCPRMCSVAMTSSCRRSRRTRPSPRR